MPILYTLLAVLIAIVIFAIIGFGMKWICDTFFSGMKAAYWICGVILIVLLVVAAIYFFGGTLSAVHP